jgi:hypothetical protein
LTQIWYLRILSDGKDAEIKQLCRPRNLITEVHKIGFGKYILYNLERKRQFRDYNDPLQSTKLFYKVELMQVFSDFTDTAVKSKKDKFLDKKE